jgi:hypothetical protein
MLCDRAWVSWARDCIAFSDGVKPAQFCQIETAALLDLPICLPDALRDPCRAFHDAPRAIDLD